VSLFKREIPQWGGKNLWELVRVRRVGNLLEVTLKDKQKKWKVMSNDERLESLSDVVNFDDDGNFGIEFPLYAHDAEKEAEELRRRG